MWTTVYVCGAKIKLPQFPCGQVLEVYLTMILPWCAVGRGCTYKPVRDNMEFFNIRKWISEDDWRRTWEIYSIIKHTKVCRVSIDEAVFKLKAKATKCSSIWINYLINALSVNVKITNQTYQKSINSASFIHCFQHRQHFLFVSGLYCYLLLWPAALALVEVAEHRSSISFTINLCRDASLKCYFAWLLLSIL